jgi:hypothetical protein
METVHGQDLSPRKECECAQKQTIAEVQMRERMAKDIADGRKVRAEDGSLGNVGSAHGPGLCGVRGRLTRITKTPSLSALDAALR